MPRLSAVAAIVLALAAVCDAQGATTTSSNATVLSTPPPKATDPPTKPPTKAAIETSPPTAASTPKATAPPTPAVTEKTMPPPSSESSTAERPIIVAPPAVVPVIVQLNNATVPLDNMTVCKCAGVADPAGRGGSSCTSLDPRNGRAYCFTAKGACADSNPILKKLNVFKEGFDLSFDACKCANEEKLKGIGGCKCANVQDARGFGASTCNSSIDAREPAWCYVKQGACCDGRPTEEPGMKKFDYSYDACACKSDPRKCRCARAGFDHAWKFGVNPGHGFCNSRLKETPGAPARSWCYTYPGSCCDGMPKKIGPFVYHISFEACEHNNPTATMPGTLPRVPESSSSGWIYGVVIMAIIGLVWAGFCIYKRRVSGGASTTGGGGRTPGASSSPSRPARQTPPPATYGALSSSRIRVEWPDNTSLHGKLMWTSTYNEATDMYICKTHEPGPNGVKPYSIKSEKLVAVVE